MQPITGQDLLGARRPQDVDPFAASPSSRTLSESAEDGDSVSISETARRLADGEEKDPARAQSSEDEQREVQELRRRDGEVRSHEQAHKAAAGSLATGGPSYTYETGPDGRRYAVGGEVNIALSEGRTPDETLRLAQQARRAALAPAKPSSQDRKVAAKAAATAARAEREVAASRDDEASSAPGNAPSVSRLDVRA